MMLLRNIWMVLLCVLVVTLSAACNQEEVVAEENTEGTLIVTADPGYAKILVQGKKYDSGSEIKLPLIFTGQRVFFLLHKNNLVTL